MGETDCGGSWVLFWWAGPCSVNLQPDFLLMGRAVFPPCCLAWVQTADPGLHWRRLDTHGQVWLRLLWGHSSFLQAPGVHKVLFMPSKNLFPQSCNKIPLASKVKFPGGSQSLCQSPRLGNLLWVLELFNGENFIGIIALQFVVHLLSSYVEGLTETSSKRATLLIWPSIKCPSSLVHEHLSPQIFTSSPNWEITLPLGVLQRLHV